MGYLTQIILREASSKSSTILCTLFSNYSATDYIYDGGIHCMIMLSQFPVSQPFSFTEKVIH